MNKIAEIFGNKFREIVLILIGLLVVLQLVVGTILDLWFGLLILAIVWFYMKVNGTKANGAPKE